MTTGGVHGENPKKSRVKLVHKINPKNFPKPENATFE